jgi:hypothetical protein
VRASQVLCLHSAAWPRWLVAITVERGASVKCLSLALTESLDGIMSTAERALRARSVKRGQREELISRPICILKAFVATIAWIDKKAVGCCAEHFCKHAVEAVIILDRLRRFANTWQKKPRVNIGENTGLAENRPIAHYTQLFVIRNGKENVSWPDGIDFAVACCVPGQHQQFRAQIF